MALSWPARRVQVAFALARGVTPQGNRINPEAVLAPTLLLTRPRLQAERFADLCRDRLGDAIDVLVAPLLQIVPTPLPRGAVAAEILVFTSEAGAHSFASQSPAAGRIAYCVGPRTEQTANGLGFRAISANGDGTALVERILADAPTGLIVHARGSEIRVDVAEALKQAGLTAESAVCYKQNPCALSAEALHRLGTENLVIAPLFSPNSAKLLADSLPLAPAPLGLVAISQAVLDAWSGPAPALQGIAAHPNSADMLKAVATIWSAGSG